MKIPKERRIEREFNKRPRVIFIISRVARVGIGVLDGWEKNEIKGTTYFAPARRFEELKAFAARSMHVRRGMLKSWPRKRAEAEWEAIFWRI